MTLPRSVSDVLRDHVTLELEGIDRMYLNVYVPHLQYEVGVASFFKFHRGATFASSALMVPMTEAFIRKMEQFAVSRTIPLITFAKHQRKDDVMKEHLAKFKSEEGVLFIGKAQEKTPVIRTERRRNPKTGQPYPWLVKSTAMVNHFYVYCVDRDFGPFFLKFCSYFPYNAKLCLNGHEYVKRQLAKDRAAGYRYDVSILQAEFSLTQVLDRPVTGRVFFEEVIRENLDIGRPGQVQLIFERKVTRSTPGRFRTRVITEGVTPSLHVDYKRTRIKQYHKEGRALRTETTINDTRDFDIGKRLKNLSALRKVGFRANRRLLDVQRISHDCAIGEKAFAQVQQPLEVDGQRASGMRFGDSRVQMLLSALLLFRLLPRGFSNADLREQLAPLLGMKPSELTQGRMTYDLRRLRLHGLLERIPKSHRYRVTDFGLRAALFFTRAWARVVRPGLALVIPDAARDDSALSSSFNNLEKAMDAWCQDAKLAS